MVYVKKKKKKVVHVKPIFKKKKLMFNFSHLMQIKHTLRYRCIFRHSLVLLSKVGNTLQGQRCKQTVILIPSAFRNTFYNLTQEQWWMHKVIYYSNANNSKKTGNKCITEGTNFFLVQVHTYMKESQAIKTPDSNSKRRVYMMIISFFSFFFKFIWLHRVLVAAGGCLSCSTWAP